MSHDEYEMECCDLADCEQLFEKHPEMEVFVNNSGITPLPTIIIMRIDGVKYVCVKAAEKEDEGCNL